MLKMEKLPEFNAEVGYRGVAGDFECQAACAKITNEKTKIQCDGGVGRFILKGLSEGDSWEEAKQELSGYLGEGDSRASAWRKLLRYQAKGKCYGEIAREVRELAVRAADEENVREQLAVEAFLGAIPWLFAQEIRMKKIENLEEALEEARTRRAIEAEEEGRRKTVHAAAEREKVVEQGQDVGPRRDRRPRRDPVGWGCGELGHVLRECPLWRKFKKDRWRKQEGNVRRTEDAVIKEALNFRGDH